jgi:hypothetical protein
MSKDRHYRIVSPDHTQDEARRLLRQLGGSGHSWDKMDPTEAQILLDILQAGSLSQLQGIQVT